MGSFASGFLAKLLIIFSLLGLLDRIGTTGRSELDRPNAEGADAAFEHDGILNISPDRRKCEIASGFLGSKQLAEDYQKLWRHLVGEMSNQFIAALVRANLIDGVLLWFQSCSSGQTHLGDVFLRDLSIKKPRQHRVIFTTLPEQPGIRDNLRQSPYLFPRLVSDGVAKIASVTDNDGPIARHHEQGKDHLDELSTRGIWTLVAAKPHWDSQPGFADLMHQAGKSSYWLASSYAVRPIPAVNLVPGWKLLPRFGAPQRGSTHLEQTIIATIEAAKEALTQHTAKAIDEPFNFDGQAVLGLLIPMKRDDRHWPEVASEVRKFIKKNFSSNVLPVFASGSGARDPRFSGDYWVQASFYWPTKDVLPEAIKQVVANRAIQQRPELPFEAVS